jgi:hypothetical protein
MQGFDVDWIGLAQDRNRRRAHMNSVLKLRVPWNAGKLSRGLTSSGLSSSAQLHRLCKAVSLRNNTEIAKERLEYTYIPDVSRFQYDLTQRNCREFKYYGGNRFQEYRLYGNRRPTFRRNIRFYTEACARSYHHEAYFRTSSRKVNFGHTTQLSDRRLKATLLHPLHQWQI